MKLRDEKAAGAIGTGLTYGIAVLAVSCPCALGLAVPMVLVIAGGVAARAGIIVKKADALERGYKVTDVVFDKTGTLTEGDLKVVHQRVLAHDTITEDHTYRLVKALVRDNAHPVSQAVARSMLPLEGDLNVEKVESIPGAGVQCIWQGLSVQAGNPYWLRLESHCEIAPLIDQGMTILCVALDSQPIVVFGLRSSIREEARAVIFKLMESKIACHIVSGDGPHAVQDVAGRVGIPTANIASRHSPVQKQEYVRKLMSSGKIVLFCGDGTNDAVAVAQANVGVQIGRASDLTRASADVVLLGSLDDILILLNLSKRVFHRIIFNFVWSGIYNLFAILLAAGAFVKVRIPPAYAGLGEIVSVVPVIVAALTLVMTKGIK
jgi:Cu2+-exporting ATPase